MGDLIGELIIKGVIAIAVVFALLYPAIKYGVYAGMEKYHIEYGIRGER